MLQTRSLLSSGSHQLVKPWHNCLSDLALSASLHHIFGIHCLPIFVKPSQFLLSDVISKRTTFSQLFLPPSDPPANKPWFFLRYQCYINHLLTYLCVASAMPDLQLPAQPKTTTTASWVVVISHPTEGRRLSLAKTAYPLMAIHLSSNWAWRRVTLLMRPTSLPQWTLNWLPLIIQYNKAISDYTSPALYISVTPFLPIGDAAYCQCAGGVQSQGHMQRA